MAAPRILIPNDAVEDQNSVFPSICIVSLDGSKLTVRHRVDRIINLSGLSWENNHSRLFVLIGVILGNGFPSDFQFRSYALSFSGRFSEVLNNQIRGNRSIRSDKSKGGLPWYQGPDVSGIHPDPSSVFFGNFSRQMCRIQGNSSVNGENYETEYFNNKFLAFFGIVFSALGIVLIYDSWRRVCFDRSLHMHYLSAVTRVLVSCSILTIGVFILLVVFMPVF